MKSPVLKGVSPQKKLALFPGSTCKKHFRCCTWVITCLRYKIYCFHQVFHSAFGMSFSITRVPLMVPIGRSPSCMHVWVSMTTCSTCWCPWIHHWPSCIIISIIYLFIYLFFWGGAGWEYAELFYAIFLTLFPYFILVTLVYVIFLAAGTCLSWGLPSHTRIPMQFLVTFIHC